MTGTGVESPGSPVTPAAPAGAGETRELRAIVTAYGRLSALAVGGADVADVTRVLADAVGSEAAVLSPTLAVMASAGTGQARPDVIERLRSHTGRRGLAPVLTAAAGARRALMLPGSTDPVRSAVVAPVTAGEDLVAYLVSFTGGAGGFGDDAALMLTEHAATMCGVVLARERVVAAAAGRARQDLIEGVLNGRARVEGEVSRWAGHLGFAEGRDHHVLAASARRRSVETDGSGRGSVAAAHATVESFLNHHAPDAIVALGEDEVVGIVPGPPRGTALAHVRDLATRCRSATEGHHPGVVVGIGIGGPCARATEIAESYSQARRSLETTRRQAMRGGVVAFAELGIQRLLLQVPDVGDLRSFADEVLGEALEQDASGGTEHLRTLVAYFRANCSPRGAAAGLHLHPNTVSYRIRRIEELTGLSLNDHRDRLLAQVAVEILAPSGEM